MIALVWSLSVAIRRYLCTYMPTNIAIDLLRTRRGLKWAVPAALVAVPAYLFAAAMASSAVEHGGPGCLNILVLLCLWDAMKFTGIAVFGPVELIRSLVGRRNATGQGPRRFDALRSQVLLLGDAQLLEFLDACANAHAKMLEG